MCQTRIYKNTNTQIQRVTKCQKDPTCGIFWKRRLQQGIKSDVPMCQPLIYKNTNTKYTNTPGHRGGGGEGPGQQLR